MRNLRGAVANGLIVAAPASGSGKTVVTAALLRRFCRAGLHVNAFKVGPDYIDPAFHAAATGRPCRNLDMWAMRPATVDGLAAEIFNDGELVVGEGVMGLFDGASDGSGSTADVAVRFGLPVVLVVDAAGVGASVAALVEGFARHRRDVTVAGVIFNRIGGVRHERILRTAIEPLGIPVFGALPRDAALTLPDRHLGLVQARETAALGAFLDGAADVIARHVDTDAMLERARPPRLDSAPPVAELPVPALGQRIAVAQDEAFAFAYPATLDGWRSAGAELTFFSPLADDSPAPDADAIYLPGGYPELHAGRLAANNGFLRGLQAAAERTAIIFGECGGYMVLGQGLVDRDGARHAMAGLLPLETSFAAPRLHLGYRRATLAADGPLGRAGTAFRGHEFHYAMVASEAGDAPLFHCSGSEGQDQSAAGLVSGHVMGSFVHLIDGDKESPSI